MVDPGFRKKIIYCVYLSAYMWILFFYFTLQILEYEKDAPDPTNSILLYDKEKLSSFYVSYSRVCCCFVNITTYSYLYEYLSVRLVGTN